MRPGRGKARASSGSVGDGRRAAPGGLATAPTASFPPPRECGWESWQRERGCNTTCADGTSAFLCHLTILDKSYNV